MPRAQLKTSLVSRDHFAAAKPVLEMTSAFSYTEVISWPPILNRQITFADRDRYPCYDGPSTAHLNGLPAPTMHGVHAALNDIATIAFSVRIARSVRIVVTVAIAVAVIIVRIVESVA